MASSCARAATRSSRVRALASRAEDLGPQDFVIVGLKAHALTGAIDAIAALARTRYGDPLCSERRALVVLPWRRRPHEGRRSGERRSRRPDLGRASDRSAPSVLSSGRPPNSQHLVSSSTIMATACRSASPPARSATAPRRLSKLLVDAGFKSPVRPNLRPEIWLKLWGNLELQSR